MYDLHTSMFKSLCPEVEVVAFKKLWKIWLAKVQFELRALSMEKYPTTESALIGEELIMRAGGWIFSYKMRLWEILQIFLQKILIA